MILRCGQSRKKAGCDGFVGAAPDGSWVLRTLGHSSEAHPRSFVLACGSCGTLYEVKPPLPRRVRRPNLTHTS